MRRKGYLVAAVLLAGITPVLLSQDASQKADLQQKLITQYALTKITADRSDIVTAGAVLAVQKDGLLMYSTPSSMPPVSTYKNGKISQSIGGGLGRGLLAGIANKSITAPQRKFVAGEKFWVTGIAVEDDGVLFSVYSDPYDNVRYYGQLKFPFTKSQVPAPDEELKTIAEVLQVQPADNSGGGQQQQPAAAAPAPPPASMAPIAPPPPPADTPPPAPKTITLGQTKDQVTASFGQAQKVVKLGAKEIDYYPDMKVTFVNGKVTDVQ